MSVLLVRVECVCGTIAAIPEGGYFPLCGQCGRRMVTPPRQARPDDSNSSVLAYVAELDLERLAVKRYGRRNPAEVDASYERQYSDDQLRAGLQQRGYPTEAQPWPKRPPWEVEAVV